MSIDRKAPLSRLVGAVAAFAMAFALAACDDDESSFVRPGDDSSSSVCEDCDDASSSSVRSSSSAPVEDLSSSSSAKSSSSARSSSSAEPALSSAEGGEDLSSSSVRSSSSAPVEDLSSSSVRSSSSAPVEDLSSSSVRSSSSAPVEDLSSSSVRSSSSAPVEDLSSSSEYVPFDHSKTLGYQKFEEDGYKTFTDPRNGRSYYYITIYSEYKGYSVTVMAENLNIGDMVLGENDQNDDTKIERYCYNNDTTKCDEFGGLYQWAEMMQLPSRCNTESCADLIQPNHQGICPDGWRLFTYDDYCVVRGYKDEFDDGIKGLRSTYGFSGTNSSGFSLTGAGVRTKKGGVTQLKKIIQWAYPDEHESDKNLYIHTGYVSASSDDAPSSELRDLKSLGLSVRCVKLEE